MALELVLQELLNIYCVQFLVMCQYERKTYYDSYYHTDELVEIECRAAAANAAHSAGKRPSTCALGSRSNAPCGGPREKIITYVLPWHLPDREEDWLIAWEVYTERFKEES